MSMGIIFIELGGRRSRIYELVGMAFELLG
jgi:hypothetical protein